MGNFTATLCLTLTVLIGSEVRGSDLPPCRGSHHNCFGTYTFANGDKYVGEFKDKKKHGQGTFTSADGSKYVGVFGNGKRHGRAPIPLPMEE